MEIIYCGRGNKILDSIAINMGFLYGIRLPHTVHFQPYFVDQNWKNPDKETYISLVKKYKPRLATVLDLEFPEQYNEVLSWAEEVSNFVEVIIIIPKYAGAIQKLPRQINDKEIRLGYSVPTKYGKTIVPIEDFRNFDVHLLGGTPHLQMKLYSKMNVVSVDCNYFSLKANKYCEFWTGKNNTKRTWLPMKSIGIDINNSHYLAFAMSCANIMRSWQKIINGK